VISGARGTLPPRARARSLPACCFATQTPSQARVPFWPSQHVEQTADLVVFRLRSRGRRADLSRATRPAPESSLGEIHILCGRIVLGSR
jgi:hypothetical protein